MFQIFRNEEVSQITLLPHLALSVDTEFEECYSSAFIANSPIDESSFGLRSSSATPQLFLSVEPHREDDGEGFKLLIENAIESGCQVKLPLLINIP